MAKNNNRKYEIIETAKVLFVEQGVDGTSMDQIAKKMQLTKASLYYYFKSKDELLEEMLKESTTRLMKHFMTERNKYLKAKESNHKQDFKPDFSMYIEERDVLRIGLGEALKKGNDGKFFKDLTQTIIEGQQEEIEDEQRIFLCISGTLIATYFTLKEDISKGLGIEEEKVDKVFEEKYEALFVKIAKSMMMGE